jgi:hypothetical protein
MTQRSDALADCLEQGARALAKFASELSEAEWTRAADFTERTGRR